MLCGFLLFEIMFFSGGLTIFVLELVRFWFVDGDEDAENAFNGIFRILGAGGFLVSFCCSILVDMRKITRKSQGTSLDFPRKLEK